MEKTRILETINIYFRLYSFIRSFLKGCIDSIPELESVGDCINGSSLNQPQIFLLPINKLIHDFICHWSMMLSIYFNMPLEIVYKSFVFFLIIEIIDKFLKHLRDRIFSPKEELSCNVSIWLPECIDSVCNELLTVFGNFGIFQFLQKTFSSCALLNKILHHTRISPNLLHAL